MQYHCGFGSPAPGGGALLVKTKSCIVEKGEKMIVKKKDGYYVLSEKTKRNLGGPYKTEEEAKKRLRQVEFFKHLAK